jgi:hypothetical protein
LQIGALFREKAVRPVDMLRRAPDMRAAGPRDARHPPPKAVR